jgi:hypothetical protein
MSHQTDWQESDAASTEPDLNCLCASAPLGQPEGILAYRRRSMPDPRKNSASVRPQDRVSGATPWRTPCARSRAVEPKGLMGLTQFVAISAQHVRLLGRATRASG